jgi:hypothetical protein
VPKSPSRVETIASPRSDRAATLVGIIAGLADAVRSVTIDERKLSLSEVSAGFEATFSC